ncbi:MAG: ribosome-associated translation inhibitor RaiA [Croceitalea sp.]|nr:ribosome-associated translation inhibitor RaiA [Croceitalea sp.]NNL07709.1 ribosome-associated translation inhibitor RaiA [Croceitalea sp.]NNM18795.1 ribosome-associated translation inhibitor RaiA [Croceitalea sp.]
MNVTFEYNGVKASDTLESKIMEKLNKLHGKYDFIVQAHVFLKTDRTHNPNTGKICKIKLSVPGPQLFAEASEHDFDRAMHKCMHELDTQLAKKKQKMRSH